MNNSIKELFKVRGSTINKNSQIYLDYINKRMTKEKYSWEKCSLKMNFQNQWIGSIMNVDDESVVSDHNDNNNKIINNENAHQKHFDTASIASTNVNGTTTSIQQMPIIDPIRDINNDKNKIICYVPYMLPGQMPMMSPSMPGFMPPGTFGGATPQLFGGTTPQYSYSNYSPFTEDPNIPPHLRKCAAKIPLDADIYETPVDPRLEKIRSGTYCETNKQQCHPYEFLRISFIDRLRIVQQNTIRDNTNYYGDKNNHLNHQHSTSGNSSDSEISPGFEPCDMNLNSSHVLISTNKRPSTSGNESDESQRNLEFHIKHEEMTPIVNGKRKRHESARARENGDNKRSKQDPIKLKFFKIKESSSSSSMASTSFKLDKSHSKSKKKSSCTKHKSSKKTIEAESFLSNSVGNLLQINDNLFSHPIPMDSFNDSCEKMEKSLTEPKPTVSNDSMNSITEQLKSNHVTLTPIRSNANFRDDSIPFYSEKLHMSEISEIDNDHNDIFSSTIIEKSTTIDKFPLNNDVNVNIINPDTKQTCQICDEYFTSPTRLVAHYVRNHSDADVYISRITQMYGNAVKNDTFNSIIANKQTKCVCPFCENVHAFISNKWITHITHHTGEYEYECIKCNQLIATQRHYRCNANSIKINDFILENDMLYAYLCSGCNFTQLLKYNVEKHIKNAHPNNDASIIKFILLKTNTICVQPDNKQTNASEATVQPEPDIETSITNAKTAAMDISAPCFDENTVDFEEATKMLEAGKILEANIGGDLAADLDANFTADLEDNLEKIGIKCEDNVNDNIVETQTNEEETVQSVKSILESSETKLSTSLIEAKGKYAEPDEDIETRLRKSTVRYYIEVSSDDDDVPNKSNEMAKITQQIYELSSDDDDK